MWGRHGCGASWIIASVDKNVLQLAASCVSGFHERQSRLHLGPATRPQRRARTTHSLATVYQLRYCLRDMLLASQATPTSGSRTSAAMPAGWSCSAQ